jgi:ferredoxin-NADP reductase
MRGVLALSAGLLPTADWLAQPPRQHPFVVLYEPDQRYILYAADFDPLARAGDIVHESGPIETLIERNRATIKESLVMAAGFDGFLDRVHQALESIDVDAHAAITETFGPQP